MRRSGTIGVQSIGERGGAAQEKQDPGRRRNCPTWNCGEDVTLPRDIGGQLFGELPYCAALGSEALAERLDREILRVRVRIDRVISGPFTELAAQVFTTFVQGLFRAAGENLSESGDGLLQ